ncbi:MAG: heme exporter protein CcmD [Oricola sp.]|jgi:heme exporter protein CcmD|nr:heme exporter protein CcmD [Oricola sp.]
MDFSAHTTPYVLTAYAVSIVAIGALIFWRIGELKKALAEEKRLKDGAD